MDINEVIIKTPKNFKPNPNYAYFTVMHFKKKNYQKLLY